jgi:predicted nucleic acid-binding protein
MLELFDTSVWAWRGRPHVETWFSSGLLDGQLAVCELVALEILSGAPHRDWYERTRELLESVPWVHMGAAEWQRALEVHRLLEQQLGTNIRRSVKHTDLLIAAAAEVHGLTLVHYDQDFDAIAEVTGQPMRWVAARGSL